MGPPGIITEQVRRKKVYESCFDFRRRRLFRLADSYALFRLVVTVTVVDNYFRRNACTEVDLGMLCIRAHSS